jgi:formamidopyrimidine-DNA glycosylase
MPELPEVELARQSLERWALGARVTLASGKDRMVVTGSPAAFARGLVGRRVEEVGRRGKQLRVALDDGRLLFAHLGMSGKWVSREPSAPAERWERARIDVEHGGASSAAAARACAVSIRYVDPRRLGRVALAVEDTRAWKALGPDPLADGVDPAALAASFARTKRTVKEVIMDQTVIAGIGNIYATEALFEARIDPRSAAAAIPTADVRALARAIKAVLVCSLRAIEAAAEEELTYVQEARANNPFRVYGRAKSPCPRCKTPLARIVLGGRGTTYCPSCQRRMR